jgi:hypothetical protein
MKPRRSRSFLQYLHRRIGQRARRMREEMLRHSDEAFARLELPKQMRLWK